MRREPRGGVPSIDPDSWCAPHCASAAHLLPCTSIAECEGLYAAELEDVCACTAPFEPVCGIDGVAYANACALRSRSRSLLRIAVRCFECRRRTSSPPACILVG